MALSTIVAVYERLEATLQRLGLCNFPRQPSHFQVSANGDSMDSGVIGRLGLVDVLNDVLRVALRTVEDDVD